MIEIKRREMCNGCSACATICPKSCINMVSDKLGFVYPALEADRCVNCGLCEAVCPDLKQKLQTNDMPPETYVAVGKDDSIREKSSSGGVFSLIAQYIISRGGVVFGAAFDNTFHSVRHIAVESLAELKKLQGSKYLQSKIGSSYADAKTYLEQGRTVLFTGTPCQISGLIAFLKKDYDNLYLQDIVCHGVPSPAVWDAYLEHLETRFGGKVIDVSFRDKKAGWKNYLLSIKFGNGNVYSNKHSDDLYMRGFLHDYYLRLSCYECKHKGVDRESDITLADCWGIEEICPELDDNKGTSLIIVSSSKGKLLFDNIAKELSLRKTDLDCALKYNQSIVRSANEYPKRNKFENEFQQKPINVLLKKYCSISTLRKIKHKVKSLLTT